MSAHLWHIGPCFFPPHPKDFSIFLYKDAFAHMIEVAHKMKLLKLLSGNVTSLNCIKLIWNYHWLPKEKSIIKKMHTSDFGAFPPPPTPLLFFSHFTSSPEFCHNCYCINKSIKYVKKKQSSTNLHMWNISMQTNAHNCQLFTSRELTTPNISRHSNYFPYSVLLLKLIFFLTDNNFSTSLNRWKTWANN